MIFGSPGLARSLMKRRLIDAYKLTLHPVMLGAGIPLFDRSIPVSKLTLLESKTLGSGVVTLYHKGRSQTKICHSSATRLHEHIRTNRNVSSKPT
ncbi:dihydrofolate reductase family protein [Spirosoma koreense]